MTLTRDMRRSVRMLGGHLKERGRYRWVQAPATIKDFPLRLVIQSQRVAPHFAAASTETRNHLDLEGS
jgi:hypothetical protein